MDTPRRPPDRLGRERAEGNEKLEEYFQSALSSAEKMGYLTAEEKDKIANGKSLTRRLLPSDRTIMKIIDMFPLPQEDRDVLKNRFFENF